MKKMKKLLSLLLAFAMTFGCMSVVSNAMTWGTKPADGTTQNQPFAPGTGGSQNFRIPCLVTLDDGTIVAACDARWNHASDACGLDTIVSRSTDGGKTWSYTFANYLGDNGNTFSYNSTAFIDPAIATDGETVWMIADIYPAGVAINTVPSTHNARPGHTGYDENHNLVLAKATSTVNGLSATNDRIAQPFDYTLVKIEGAKDTDASYYNIIDKDGNVVEGYEIDAFFNIKGEGVDTNLFVGDSPYFPWPTDFLYMTKSEDGGATWSIPTLIDVKRADEQTLLVGPGRGIVVELPNGKERIIFTAYDFTYSDDKSSAIYSDDGGKTWTRGADVAAWSSESVVTEADGRLYLFTRHGNAYYISEDFGETWGPQLPTGLTYNSNCQLTAITYSEKVDGKTAILFAAPSSTSSRSAGKIFLGLVQEDGKLSWENEYSVNGSGNYAYSCMDELANGNIALLYESAGSAITYTEIDKNLVLGYEKNITLDMGESYVESKEANGPKEITQRPEETIATATSEFEVKDAVIKLRDHIADADSSLSSFAVENGAKDLSECEFTFTANGDYWQINNGDKYIALTNASNYFGTATNLTVEKAENNTFRIALPNTDGAKSRYAVFYTQKMVFDAWATDNVAGVTNSAVKFDLVLLEKQDEISPADVVPGYTRATEVKDGGVYLISYIWGADTEDKTDNGLIVLYPTNGQAAQTKLRGSIETSAKSVVTITGVGAGETTAVIGGVTYNITVLDPTKSPSYAGNDIPVEKLTATAGSEEALSGNNTKEGPASFVLDGDETTIWHTEWDGSSRDVQWIQFELSEDYVVDGLRYQPRQSGTNGMIKKYIILTSNDGTNWEKATEGTWDTSTEWKKVTFDGEAVKYVRLKVEDAASDNAKMFAAATEIRLTGTKAGAPQPTVTEAPQPSVTEAPQPSVTEAPQPSVTEAPQPTEAPGTTEDVKTVFSDVHKDWYTDYVQYVYDNNLMTGIKGTTQFAPNANITKAQVAQVLYNMENQPEVADKKVFTDLKDVYKSEWYADAVAWAYSTGVVTGDLTTKKFNPNADVTREQLALMMFRYAQYKKYDTSATSDFAGLANAHKVASWSMDGVKWAVGAGLISGVEKNGVKDLDPQGNASRAQMAAILQRFCEAYK